MNKYRWLQVFFVALVILISLADSTSLAIAEDAGQASNTGSRPEFVPLASTAYALTEQLDVRIKGVYCAPSADGTQAGVVVRLTNHGNEKFRVPEYEIHLIAKNGSDYSLVGSSDNPLAVMPDSTIELSYLTQISGNAKVEPDRLSWQDVNNYVFPKTVREVLSVSVAEKVWSGIDLGQNPSMLPAIRWKEPFVLPNQDSPIRYTLMQADYQDTATGHSSIVQVLADNTDPYRIETIPSFTLGASDKSHMAVGRLLKNDPILLQPGEKTYIQYQIDTDPDVKLNTYYVLSVEHFTRIAPAPNGQTSTVSYTTGIYRIPLENGLTETLSSEANYMYGVPILFDPVRDAVPTGLQVSLIDLHSLTTDDLGNDTMVARFLFTNSGRSTLPKPSLQTELDLESQSYTGTAVQSAAQLLTPGSTYMFSYQYSVPPGTNDKPIVLKLKTATSGSGSVTVAAIKVHPTTQTDHTLTFYPFKVIYDQPSFAGWLASTNPQTRTTDYAYKVIMDLNVEKLAQIVPDNSVAQLKIDITDYNGSVLGSRSLSFTGTNRVLGGRQDLLFTSLNAELSAPLKIKIYEVVQTPTGPAQNLLGTFDS